MLFFMYLCSCRYSAIEQWFIELSRRNEGHRKQSQGTLTCTCCRPRRCPTMITTPLSTPLFVALTETGVSARLNVACLTSVPDGGIYYLFSEERPWSFVDDDICERYVDVHVHYSGTFDNFIDEREPDQNKIKQEQINQSGGTYE